MKDLFKPIRLLLNFNYKEMEIAMGNFLFQITLEKGKILGRL